jgi:uncharacterized RDD family membrane protein YckC
LTTHELSVPGQTLGVEQTYAGWWSRVGAALLDGIIAFVLILAGAAIGGAMNVPAVAVILAIAWYACYYVLGHGSESGQTLGKKAASIAVRREGGGRAGYGVALWRFIAQFLIGVIPLIGILNLLAPLWDSKNQCWHDKLAGTVVVDS